MEFKLLSFDIDNTLITSPEVPSLLVKAWDNEEKNEYPLLTYNTGRLLNDTLQLIKRNILPEPDYIISGVGTNIYDFKNKKTLKEFSQILEEGWDLKIIQQIIDEVDLEIIRQPGHFQNDFKRSYYLNDATSDDVAKVEELLDEAGLDVNVVYSSNKYLDILPKWANKGNALQWLLKHLNIPTEKVIVGGDSGNDKAMFLLKGIRGIVVGNARHELYQATKHVSVYHAERTCANGILEGLHHYGLISDELLDIDNTAGTAIPDKKIITYLDKEPINEISVSELEFIHIGYEYAVQAIKKNITPLGFSACSLDDNTSKGTDINYQSVWARDGAITIIGTLGLINDEEVHKCQRATFETLLRHLSPNGQMPSNVRLETDTPDYSGVGGICSIDSGLWLVIAFYEYIRATRDIDFLKQHIFQLKEVMNWLSAHDGNNDALLEIPEAGDWTDLFGRSYNVLYDEVLWYKANICFGRLLELLGDDTQAGGYLRWSQVIRKEILLHFWPTTKTELYENINFAEQQYALGDAQYLISQVTPFDFNWRCDTFGNILAFLFDVITIDKATSAFRFMWGVGVNEPYPVANVYPIVNSGDPDWRPYYTVNLLNLPHHYHNGGIWSFVGGAWVRYINKLGLRKLALSELHKLAELNKLGVHDEWEFNEWAHGKTGRPMGKSYQAWSASEFIHACNDLKIAPK